MPFFLHLAQGFSALQRTFLLRVSDSQLSFLERQSKTHLRRQLSQATDIFHLISMLDGGGEAEADIVEEKDQKHAMLWNTDDPRINIWLLLGRGHWRLC